MFGTLLNFYAYSLHTS